MSRNWWPSSKTNVSNKDVNSLAFCVEGFPQCYWYGVEGDYNVLVMNILGPNLQ